MPRAARRSPARVSKAQTLDLVAASQAVGHVDQLTVEQLVGQMGNLQTTIQGSLAQLSTQLATKLDEAKQIDLAIAEKERRFKELTDKESAAVSLDELNIEIEETREKWQREQDEQEEGFEQVIKAGNERVTRATNQSKYEHEQAVAKWTQAHAATVEETMRKERLRQEDLQRGWDQRELAIKEQEEEITNLRTEVANFPTRLKSEVDAAVAAATSNMKTSYEHQIALAARENKAALDLAVKERDQATSLVENLRAQITAAETRASNAEQRTLDVMNNALSVEAYKRQAEAVQSVATSTGAGGKR